MPRELFSRMKRLYIRWLIRALRFAGAFGAWAQRRLIACGYDSLSPLHSAIADVSPVVRYRAVYAIGKIGDPHSLDIILGLVNDEDEAVRYDALMSIGYLGDKRGISPLHKLRESFEEGSADESACMMALVMLDAME